MSAVNAGGLSQAWLHWCREAALRVRSHISPGPYRSFRELSLAGSVDPDIWCPPTFVGNSGIECFNGLCGFALLCLLISAELITACPSGTQCGVTAKQDAACPTP